MSLRKQAKILGISPPYLSLLLNGKRPWRGNLKERYLELVNTFVNTPEANAPTTKALELPQKPIFVPKTTGAGEGIRAHTPVKGADFKSAASSIPPPRPPSMGRPNNSGARRRTRPGYLSPSCASIV